MGKKCAFEMWASLTKLYQSTNQNKNMVLKEKLRNAKMFKSDTVASYLTKITQFRDDLGEVGETVDSEELVRSTLSGFPLKWDVFVHEIVTWENMPSWDRLWDDFIQEENDTFQNYRPT